MLLHVRKSHSYDKRNRGTSFAIFFASFHRSVYFILFFFMRRNWLKCIIAFTWQIIAKAVWLWENGVCGWKAMDWFLWLDRCWMDYFKKLILFCCIFTDGTKFALIFTQNPKNTFQPKSIFRKILEKFKGFLRILRIGLLSYWKTVIIVCLVKIIDLRS